VAIARRSGGSLEVWSSPYTNKPAFDYFTGDVASVLSKIASIYFSNQGHFLGWTECLAGKRVVEAIPESSPAPQPEPSPAPIGDSYTVKPGDTLGQIAIDQGWSDGSNLWGADGYIAKLAAANDIADPNLIHPGQVVKKV
jgi:LysM repeat protein